MTKVPLDTEPKLKGHNIFRRRPRHSITYVLFTSCLQGLRLINLHPHFEPPPTFQMCLSEPLTQI